MRGLALDEGIVFEIDRDQVIREASLVKAIGILNGLLSACECRFDELLSVYLVTSKTVRDQDVELERLRGD